MSPSYDATVTRPRLAVPVVLVTTVISCTTKAPDCQKPMADGGSACGPACSADLCEGVETEDGGEICECAI